jgi:hypothetical protein
MAMSAEILVRQSRSGQQQAKNTSGPNSLAPSLAAKTIYRHEQLAENGANSICINIIDANMECKFYNPAILFKWR